MPGYVIHLAIAKEYLKNNKMQNEQEFFKGVISPDMLKTFDAHYGIKKDELDICKLEKEVDFKSSYGQGYYLHLVTDYIFYFKFLPNATTQLNADYDILNEYLVKKYKVSIPTELVDIVQFKIGTPKLINESSISEFIDMVSDINLEQYFEHICKQMQ